MVENICSNLDKKINKFVEKKVTVVQEGFLESRYLLKNLQCKIEYEILSITDKESENLLKINLNQVYKILERENKIEFYLDEDTIIKLELNI